MWLLPAGLWAARPAPSAPAALIAEASRLAARQDGRPADEVRALDKKLDALNPRFAKLGRAAVPALARGALDGKQPLKLRIWLVMYLQATRSVDAFPPLRRLVLDPAQDDLLRDAAAAALADNPVGRQARSRALCGALAAAPGPQLRHDALLSVSRLGCEDPAPLEAAAAAAGSRPEGRAADETDLAIDALRRSPPPAALDALDRLLRLFKSGTPQRGRVLDALAARAPQLQLDFARWSERSREALREETRAPGNAVAALKLIAALDDPASAPLVARYLGDPDPHVVVAAAETLAALHARQAAPAVAAVYEGYYGDARFANGPGVDPVALYDRLAAALKALK